MDVVQRLLFNVLGLYPVALQELKQNSFFRLSNPIVCLATPIVAHHVTYSVIWHLKSCLFSDGFFGLLNCNVAVETFPASAVFSTF